MVDAGQRVVGDALLKKSLAAQAAGQLGQLQKKAMPWAKVREAAQHVVGGGYFLVFESKCKITMARAADLWATNRIPDWAHCIWIGERSEISEWDFLEACFADLVREADDGKKQQILFGCVWNAVVTDETLSVVVKAMDNKTKLDLLFESMAKEMTDRPLPLNDALEWCRLRGKWIQTVFMGAAFLHNPEPFWLGSETSDATFLSLDPNVPVQRAQSFQLQCEEVQARLFLTTMGETEHWQLAWGEIVSRLGDLNTLKDSFIAATHKCLVGYALIDKFEEEKSSLHSWEEPITHILESFGPLAEKLAIYRDKFRPTATDKLEITVGHHLVKFSALVEKPAHLERLCNLSTCLGRDELVHAINDRLSVLRSVDLCSSLGARLKEGEVQANFDWDLVHRILSAYRAVSNDETPTDFTELGEPCLKVLKHLLGCWAEALTCGHPMISHAMESASALAGILIKLPTLCGLAKVGPQAVQEDLKRFRKLCEQVRACDTCIHGLHMWHMAIALCVIALRRIGVAMK
jgi:hypothetical protein